MVCEILLTPKSVRQLKSLDKTVQERIKEKLRNLRENPLGRERLAGTKYLKLRVGDYRIIFRADEQEKKVVVLYVGHRSKVYDDFKKLI